MVSRSSSSLMGACLPPSGARRVRGIRDDTRFDHEHGNRPLANQEMAAALQFAGHDYDFVFGEGAHNGNHGGAIFPNSMRWLWRE
jgi:hypothetical protein